MISGVDPLSEMLAQGLVAQLVEALLWPGTNGPQPHRIHEGRMAVRIEERLFGGLTDELRRSRAELGPLQRIGAIEGVGRQFSGTAAALVADLQQRQDAFAREAARLENALPRR